MRGLRLEASKEQTLHKLNVATFEIHVNFTQLGLTREVFERNWIGSGTISRAFFHFLFFY